jgi:hypothetical protein
MPYYELLSLQCEFGDTAEKGRDKDFARFIERQFTLEVIEPMPNTPLDMTAETLARRIVMCAMARRKLMEAEALAAGIDVPPTPTVRRGGLAI